VLHPPWQGRKCITAQLPLDIHAFLWPQKHLITVNMRAETHAVRLNLAQITQRPDLKSAGIGKDGAIPGHKAVQATHLFDKFRTGAEHQVIGITEDDLCANLIKVAGCHGLDCCLRANWHENRRFYHAMWQMHATAPCKTAFGTGQKFKFQRRHGAQAAMLRTGRNYP